MNATTDLIKLDQQIRERLEAAERNDRRRLELLKHEIAEGVQRTRRFGRIAAHLVKRFTCPRFAQLATYSENAELSWAAGKNHYHSLCRFRHTEN